MINNSYLRYCIDFAHDFHGNSMTVYHIYPTPPLGQDITQGQFLSGV